MIVASHAVGFSTNEPVSKGLSFRASVSPAREKLMADTRNLNLRAPYQSATPYSLLGTNVVVMADYAVLQVSAGAHARTGEQNAAFDRDVRPDPAVAADGHVPEELDSPPDHRVFSYQDVPLYLRRGVNLGVLPDPQPLATLLAGDLDPDLA